jgi:hypothetical protein
MLGNRAESHISSVVGRQKNIGEPANTQRREKIFSEKLFGSDVDA